MSDERRSEQELPSRRGWQLPHPVSRDDPPEGMTSPKSSATNAANAPAPPPRADYSGPRPTLPGSVLGQVTKVTVGSVTVNDMPEAIVMLRLERHDPHAGRTSICDVRLDGNDTIGFASVGDWIEAIGKRKSSHLTATEAINHTTGGIYKPSGIQRHKMLVALALFLTIALIMVTVFVTLVRRGDADFRKQVQQQEQEFEQQRRQNCLKTGLPESVCE